MHDTDLCNVSPQQLAVSTGQYFDMQELLRVNSVAIVRQLYGEFRV